MFLCVLQGNLLLYRAFACKFVVTLEVKQKRNKNVNYSRFLPYNSVLMFVLKFIFLLKSEIVTRQGTNYACFHLSSLFCITNKELVILRLFFSAV